MFVEVQAWQDGRGGRSADQSALPCACFLTAFIMTML
jgi:hypothetical protein